MENYSYSKRIGKVQNKKPIQMDSMDEELRNRLWNSLYAHYFEKAYDLDGVPRNYLEFLERLCFHYFNKPLDEMGSARYEAEKIKEYVLSADWNRVYDLLQIIPQCYIPESPNMNSNEEFKKFCNNILEKESAPCRFVGNDLLNIVDKHEIEEVEEASGRGDKYVPISRHIKKAISLLADRKLPDFSNSIKESISAVEAACQIITGNSKATLGDALNVISKKKELHANLKEAFKKLYSYTSDADGIRHALSGDSNLAYEDAKFMLVCCSAFVNYLVMKVAKDV